MQFSELPANPDYDALRGSRLINLSLSGLVSLPLALAFLHTPQGRPSGPPASFPIQLRDDQAILNEPLPEVMTGKPGEVGGSNRKGNGSIDRSLLKAANPPEPPVPPLPTADLQSQSQPTPNATSTAIEQIRVDSRLPPLDKALPIRPGGNGVSQGDGEGFGRGSGDGFGDGQGGGGLTLLRASTVTYRSNPGEPPLTGKVVRVRLLVGADGIPMEAHVIFGPAHTHEAARKAALEWRFQVPEALKSRAPIPAFIEIRFKTARLGG